MNINYTGLVKYTLFLLSGIIFVVDSHARYKIPEAKEQLTFLLNEDDLKDALLLILSNKQVCASNNLL